MARSVTGKTWITVACTYIDREGADSSYFFTFIKFNFNKLLWPDCYLVVFTFFIVDLPPIDVFILQLSYPQRNRNSFFLNGISLCVNFENWEDAARETSESKTDDCTQSRCWIKNIAIFANFFIMYEYWCISPIRKN